MKFSSLVCAAIVLACGAGWAQNLPAAALFSDAQFEDNARLVPLMRGWLGEVGFDVVELDAPSLCSPDALAVDRISLLVLPDARRLPMQSIPVVKEYLQRGGDLLVLNAPAWRDRLVQVEEKWQTPEEYRAGRATHPVPNVFIDFNTESLDAWHRSAFRMEAATQYALVPDGLSPGVAALDVNMPEMEGWDSACRGFSESPFPEGHTVTVFSAKGSSKTNRLAVEWRERDGSRWIAVVPLTESWQQFALAPEDFNFWESVPARAAEVMNPANVDMIAFTLAYTHTGHLNGVHHFQVAQVGTAPLDDTHGELLKNIPAPAFEIVSPGYKFYDMSGVASLKAAPGQQVIADAVFPVPASLSGLHPRPEAGGFDKKRPWRWLPLLEAYAADGDLRGCVASMMVQAGETYRGGIWASFAIEDPQWYGTEEGKRVLKNTLARMKVPVFLMDGGANLYTCFPGQEICLGATVFNAGAETLDGITVRADVTGPDGKVVETVSWSELTFPGGAPVPFEHRWTPQTWPEGGYRVRTVLSRDNSILDSAEHELHCWKPKEPPSFVGIKDGDFVLDGKKWRPHGVNYMPSSGIGIEWQHYFEQWLGAAAYSPRVIQRDLERCVAMGCNALSIFVYREAMETQNLIDLLRRMDALGLKANVSLRPGTPMDLPRDVLRDLITYCRLAENDTVFAYDLAWEPQFRDSERDPFNRQWEAWIVDRYGSLENAEKDWGCSVPRDEQGNVINYKPEMISGEGPWERMIAAYRRFLDTLLYEKYSEARRFVKSLDPNHHVSFRMSMAGDPTDRNYSTILYDFAYLAGAVDQLEPEAYGRIGDWERVKPGRFTFEYGRWANPALPVLWAEAGVHAWDMSLMRPGEDALAFQAQYYTDFYRMMMESGADGIFWWWYPGGFRVNENSDYGIINPDGTDRPVTKVIREHAPLFTQAPSAKAVDTWLTFDRDKHKNGLTGIYTELEGAFWAAIAEGKTPGLKTDATGTDSTNCPPLAVGNVPWTGSNPPKYLDAYCDVVEVLGKDGNWKRVLSGDTVSVGAGPVRVRLSATNLGEAALVPPAEVGEKPGAVLITCTGDFETTVPLPRRLNRFENTLVEMEVSPRTASEKTALTWSFVADQRTAFGQKFRLTLETK